MKYRLLIVLVIIAQSCLPKKNLEQQAIPKEPESISHELITGQWVETNSLNRLKERDIADPHPFNWLSSHQDILTCYKDGKPFFWDFSHQNGFLEKKGDYYFWMNEDSVKIKLQFSVSGKDTLLIYEYQFRMNEPFVHSLSKISRPTPCDFDYYPGIDLRSGRSKCYNQYYFTGEYDVKEMATNQTSSVEITADFRVTGMPGVEKYSVYTYGTPLLFQLYDVDTLHSRPIIMEGKQYPRVTARNTQYLVVSGQDNGFDLHSTDYSGKSSMAERRFRILEKVYEFRRK